MLSDTAATTIRFAPGETARADALAERMGVSRARIVRAALLAVEGAGEDALAGLLNRLPPDRRLGPRSGGLRENLLAALPVEGPGMTYTEITVALREDVGRWIYALRTLVDEGQVARSGAGKRGDPYRFRRSA